MNKKGKPQQFTVEQIVEAIKDTGGLKTEVCRKLGCGRVTIYRYIERYPEIKDAFEDEEEKVLDMAEGNLFSLIQNGELTAIFYYLNNKGKRRGYGLGNADKKLEENVCGTQSGVLVTPGLLTEGEWEVATQK